MGVDEHNIIVWGSCGHADQVLATDEEEQTVKTRLQAEPCHDCREVARHEEAIERIWTRRDAFTTYARLLDA